MRFEFMKQSQGGKGMLAEAEVVFDDDEPLAGLKLVGFKVWRSDRNAEIYVTMPSRAFGVGSDRRYFDFLRPAGENGTAARELKAKMVEAFQAWSERAR